MYSSWFKIIHLFWVGGRYCSSLRQKVKTSWGIRQEKKQCYKRHEIPSKFLCPLVRIFCHLSSYNDQSNRISQLIANIKMDFFCCKMIPICWLIVKFLDSILIFYNSTSFITTKQKSGIVKFPFIFIYALEKMINNQCNNNFTSQAIEIVISVIHILHENHSEICWWLLFTTT